MQRSSCLSITLFGRKNHWPKGYSLLRSKIMYRSAGLNQGSNCLEMPYGYHVWSKEPKEQSLVVISHSKFSQGLPRLLHTIHSLDRITDTPEVPGLPYCQCNGVFGFCRPHTQKQRQNWCVHDLPVPCGILLCSWYTHLTNHGYFDYGETQRPPI